MVDLLLTAEANFNSMLYALVIALIIQLLFFIIAFTFKSDKVTDLSYGLTFILIVSYLFTREGSYMLPQILNLLMVGVWGIRLISYLFIRILKIKKDSRFDQIRERFWSFAAFWFFQGISVWVIMIPSILIQSNGGIDRLVPTMWFGVSIWLVGLIIETFADYQKFTFKNKPENKGRWIQSGLWRYSRHPNYFGEMLCWWGIFVFSIPQLDSWAWLSIIGPLYISFILLFVSGIPPLEKRYDGRYQDNVEYRLYKQRTSILIPLPVKKLKSS